MRITKVYTRQGDEGFTRLGGGQVVSKTATRVKTYGAVDELNSVLGLAIAFEPHKEVGKAIVEIQHRLFQLGGDLCVLEADKVKWNTKGIEKKHISNLEDLMDNLNKELAPLEEFVLPGGTRAAAFLHQARCVCRRAETLAVQLAAEEDIGKHVIIYLNRLSDTLFVLARYDNFKRKQPDILWDKKI